MSFTPYIPLPETLLLAEPAYPNNERWFEYGFRKGHKAARRAALAARSARKYRTQLNRRRARK